MRWGSWDDPRARATRGRRLPSLDARSWDHPSHPLKMDSLLRPCLGKGASRRTQGWAGEKSGLFEHPAQCSSVVLDMQTIEVQQCHKNFSRDS